MSRLRLMPFFIALLSFLLTSCSTTASNANEPVVDLSSRIAESPTGVAERYMMQYQSAAMPQVFQSTLIYDRNGELIAETYAEGRRIWKPLSAIDSDLISATVATEDNTFFANIGIDPARIAIATIRNLRRGTIVSGASTITMQLARNLFFTPDQRLDQSMDRKVEEAQIARDLTKIYSKQEILEIYLNLLNYGNLAYGPEAAAQTYFGKSASDLSLAEATLLAGIPQAPAYFDPFRNFEAVKERQGIVLSIMVRHKILSQEDADAIFAEPLALRSDGGTPVNRAPHFVQYVLDQLQSETGADRKSLLNAGLRITTTLDLKLQAFAQKTVTENVARLATPNNISNAALVALKPNSGEILAMVGSADFDDAAIDGQVNVAVRMRQPGSAIKPLFYATAIDDNLISPATVLWDIPVSYTVELDKAYLPTNYDGKFHGPVTVRTALANSYNIPAVKLVDAVGVERMLQGARSLGVISLDKPTNWYGLSLTLGGGEVTLLDLANGFHTLASDGRYFPARSILGIESSWGQSILLPQPYAVQAISPETAFLISDILSDNIARAPAFGSNSPLRLSRPAAAKTGTTTDFKDNWTIGYTRFLVAGVWAGNNDGRPLKGSSGVTGAAPIWHSFMEGVLADPALLAVLGAADKPEDWNFSPPAGIELRSECPTGTACRRGGEYFSQQWLEKSNSLLGPLGDSVEVVQSAPVLLPQGDELRRAGYCTLPDGKPRQLLRLRNRLGLPDPALNRTQIASGDVITDSDLLASTAIEIPEIAAATPTPSLADFGETPRLSNDELGQISSWAIRFSAPVNLGRCADVKARIPQAIIGAANDEQTGAVGVDTTTNQTGTPSTEVTDTLAIDAQVIEIEGELLPTPTPDATQIGVAATVYLPSGPVVHDQSCAGQYVMGQISNHQGALVSGVRLILRDEWGNQYDALSKNGATDSGFFDFPVYSFSPHRLYLTVVDGAGTPLSPTITIPHLIGESDGKPCHRVNFVGG